MANKEALVIIKPEDDLDDDDSSSRRLKDSLTDWENEPSLAELKSDLQDATIAHDEHVSDVDIWLDNLNVTGSAKIKPKVGRSSIVPKLIRKQAEWRYASLSSPFLDTQDIFNVSPVAADDKEAARQNEMILNNQFNTKLNKLDFIDEYVRTAVDEGTVIIRTGWDFEEEEVEVEVPEYDFRPTQDPQAVQMFQQMQQQVQANPEALKQLPPPMAQAFLMGSQMGVPVMPVQIGTRTEIQTKTVKNQPTIEVCNYNNVIVDPTCEGDLDRAQFIIFSFETSKAELEKDGIYENLDKIRPDEVNPLNDPDHEIQDDSNFTFSDEPRKKILAYEYWGFWDIENTGMVKPFVATWVGNTMIRMEENPFPDNKLPFTKVHYLPVRKSIYGEPDGELLEDNQKIIGAVTRGMIDVMGKSANGQQGSRVDALDITNKRKFDRGEDYEYNAAVDPRQAFYMHTYPEIPQSAQYMLGMQTADAESLTGVRPFAQSATGTVGANTATGVKTALDATAQREIGILRRLAEGMRQVARKIIAMNAVFLSEEEIVRITNDEFIAIRRDDLAGNFDLELNISTAEADNMKAEELAFMLQTTAQSMGPEFAQIILSEIATLRKMPALSKRIAEYAPKPDPLTEQLKQLELQKMQAEIAKLQSETQENGANAQLDMAKAITEQAKASNLGSDTDLKNLDYLETESGTKHARDVDKMQAQADAQTKTKIVDNLMKASSGNNPTTSNGLSSI